MYKLLCEYKRGNNKALEKIIENFIPLILKEASKYKIKCYDYEDLVQHGYLSVIKACNKYKDNGDNFIPYCIKAIKNNYKALLKGEIKHYREIPDEFILNKAEDYMFTLEDEVIAYEKIKELYKALDKLSSNERYIIGSFYIENKAMGEIASTTSKNYNEIRYAKDKAIKKLQKYLNYKGK
ncbi:RNA polymerase sigma factor (plasmid) [Clostridium tetani]|uniref:RNA polymerase sigma factor n=1 Tax=Clostridium tetani TaxID=1513 RepID=A0A4Q0V9N3_CLOTA|nr:sigma-70 family RNA polymerase sigma factor [Clostridium tetani]RXI44286.1 sigma-70 family RNA polymerase sigma factor [Clostridium tetani]RXI49210.1 sigma-70 family RNA polymerase sigma factor [Clostridium tetani]RXI56608.1 sigma-70 family RNA polymerase sigma factor [Clostridium tetani]RXM72382.1 sigma-70 family RNA polymerase sigma factor [Clostridium tetani]BDR68546.1 RNA polymerase sigma factor [Clostridium tetani]